jgi:c-di-GMP-binding flagellar brake protein YcgR
MVPTSETTRIYLNEHRQGVVTCVHCGVKHTINMSNYTDDHLGEKSLKVKCSMCKKTFYIKFDLRKYHRININISGKIFCSQSEKEISDITIISLSLGGIGFFVKEDLNIKNNGIYIIKFQLDDEHVSVICEEIIIRRVDGSFVGAEFYHSDKYNHELDFYITAASWDT